MKKFLIFIVGCIGFSGSLVSANAHIGESAHIPAPFMNSVNDITFCKSPGVADGFEFLEKVNEIDPGFVTGPDMHVDTGIDNCNVIGHRINVYDDNTQACVTWTADPDPDGNPSFLRMLNGNAHPQLANTFGCQDHPAKRTSCASILFILGMHFWDGEGVQGCLSGPFTAPNGSDLHTSERSALNNAYS